MNKNRHSWTGERLETFVFNDVAIEHLHRYYFTIPYIKGKSVLDVASGEGYGTNIISQYAQSVVGVDIDADSVGSATAKYPSSKIKFLHGSADSLPVEDRSIDVVVSFETIEHHDRHDEMLQEIKRVLKPDGLLIISTPDKKHYSDDRNFQNQHHIKELYKQQFIDLLERYFDNTLLFTQDILKGSIIVPEQNSGKYEIWEGSYEGLQGIEDFKPKYILSICSDQLLPQQTTASVFSSQKILLTERSNIFADGWMAGIASGKETTQYKIGNSVVKPLKKIRQIFFGQKAK